MPVQYNQPVLRFTRVIGVDYSGAGTADDPLPGLRVYLAEGDAPPVEVRPPDNPRRHWTRRALAHWLAEQLGAGPPALVGIDHGFSFPLEYFEQHGLPLSWADFLDDFCRHWVTDQPGVSVEDVRRGRVGSGAQRSGQARWRRLADRAAGSAKSVFHFDVQGSVAKSTHAGLPWLRFLRAQLGERVHFWPFDGWDVPCGRSLIAEVYPSLWRAAFTLPNLTPDQRDAYVVAARLQHALRTGELEAWLRPALDAPTRARAAFEGWILGVG